MKKMTTLAVLLCSVINAQQSITTPEAVSNRGKIVVVYGPSSVGKTTVLNLLQKKFNTSIFDSIDATYLKAMVPNLKKINPEAYKTLSSVMTDDQIATSLFTRRYQFKGGSNQQEVQNAVNLLNDLTKDWDVLVDTLNLKKAESDMFKLAIEKATHGEAFFLEITDYESFKQTMGQVMAAQPDTPPVTVKSYFLYMSPKTLSQRILLRSQKAMDDKNPLDERFGTFMFNQLAALVKPKTSTDQFSLGTFDRQELLAIFQKHFDLGLKHFPIPTDVDPNAAKNMEKKEKQQLLNDFGLTNQEKVELTPKYPYDLVVFMDSDQASEKAATTIGDHLLAQQPK